MSEFKLNKCSLTIVWLLLIGNLFIVISAAGEKWPTNQSGKSSLVLLEPDDQQSLIANQQEDGTTSEQVDKLVRSTGDFYWRQQQPDWYQRTLDKIQLQSQIDALAAGLDDFHDVGYDRITSGSPRNYRALVSEFKHWSPVANPSRESRAFKPKLMSTARGFGKRAYPMQQHVTYADLLGSSSSNGPMSTNGKMNALSSKHAEWVNQVLSRWPSLDKYINNKFVDYNGDGFVSIDEKYQSL